MDHDSSFVSVISETKRSGGATHSHTYSQNQKRAPTQTNAHLLKQSLSGLQEGVGDQQHLLGVDAFCIPFDLISLYSFRNLQLTSPHVQRLLLVPLRVCLLFFPFVNIFLTEITMMCFPFLT
jgi:hypothetical protein